MSDFVTRLEQALGRTGLNKGQLATRCGVALSTVSRWYKGTPPHDSTVARVAQVLGVDRGWLLHGTSSQATSPETPLAWIKSAMEQKRLSAAEVSRRASIDPAYMSMLLNGKRLNPSPDVVAALKAVLVDSSPSIGEGDCALLDQLEAHFRTGLLLVDELRRKLSTGEAGV